MSISSSDDSSLSIDLISLNKSMRSQIEYSVTLVRTTESHAFQFLKKLSLSSRFVFVIVLNERINRKSFLDCRRM